MLRTLMAGMVGGVVLVAWSALFSALGPVGARPQGAAQATAALGDSVAGLVRGLPFGPAEASAAEPGRAASSSGAGLDLAAAAQGLGVACLAATFAAMLMATLGSKRSFAERLVVAVLLGCFAGAAMLVPGGGWAEFSLAESAPLIGETLVGWLLAGMVIAVAITPRGAKARR
jgi:hypothetical protein